MKIALLSDVHLGVRKNSDSFKTIAKNFFENTVSNIIEKNNISQLWILGDLFHDRIKIEGSIKRLSFDIFDYLLNNHTDLNIYVLTGNHDIYYKNSLNTNWLTMFKEYNSRLHIINNQQYLEIDGCKTIVYPWICPGSNEEEHLLSVYDHYIETGEKQYDLCLGHFAIEGFQVIKNVSCNDGLKQKYFEPYNEVFSGHFHIRQKLNHINYCGCPFQMDWNDYGDIKGIYVFDTKSKKYKFIENKDSPSHMKIYSSLLLKNEKEFKKIKNNIIKLFIDEYLNDDEILDLLSRIENKSPLSLTVINEVEGTKIENDDVELNSDISTDDIDAIYEYIDQIEHPENVEINELKIYSKDLYDRSLKGN